MPSFNLRVTRCELRARSRRDESARSIGERQRFPVLVIASRSTHVRWVLRLTERLGLILDWYKGMISAETGRLVYTYDPQADVAVTGGNPIRDIASVWDMELVSRFLARSDLDAVIGRSLEHYLRYVMDRDGALMVDPSRLGEPSSIAHSAFMLLALLDSDLQERREKIAGSGSVRRNASTARRRAREAASVTRSRIEHRGSTSRVMWPADSSRACAMASRRWSRDQAFGDESSGRTCDVRGCVGAVRAAREHVALAPGEAALRAV